MFVLMNIQHILIYECELFRISCAVNYRLIAKQGFFFYGPAAPYYFHCSLVWVDLEAFLFMLMVFILQKLTQSNDSPILFLFHCISNNGAINVDTI